MPTEQLIKLAEELGFSEGTGTAERRADGTTAIAGIPSPLPTDNIRSEAPPDTEAEFVTAMRMQIRYFIRTSMERYGDLDREVDEARLRAIENQILASDEFVLSLFREEPELMGIGLEIPPGDRRGENLWLRSARRSPGQLAKIPEVYGSPDFLPGNDYRRTVATPEARRAIDEAAPYFWIPRLRYYEDAYGFRYRVKYINADGDVERIRSFTDSPEEVFQILTQPPRPGWKIDDIAVSCHCNGEAIYGTVRSTDDWTTKLPSQKIYVREEDRIAAGADDAFSHSLESEIASFRRHYTPNARVLLLMCWSVRLHNLMLEEVCGKLVKYFKHECWINPFRLDLDDWHLDVPTMSGSPTGPLPDPKDCVGRFREMIWGT